MAALALKILAAATFPAVISAASQEGQDLVVEMADSVLAWKQELLQIPWEIIRERDVGYCGELPILDNATCTVKQESLGTTREVQDGVSPNIAIGAVYIKDSDQPPQPPANFRMGGTVGGLDVIHLNGVVNPPAELTVWQWQRNKFAGAKEWLAEWVRRYPDKLVILHYGGEFLYGGCTENIIQFKYDQIVTANGGTKKIVLGAEVSPYPSDLGYKYDNSPDQEAKRLDVLSDFGLADGWVATYANCTGELNSVCDPAGPKYRYANLGFVAGPATDVLDMLSQLEKYTDPENQLATEFLFADDSPVALDYAGVLTMSLHNLVKNGQLPVEVVDTAGKKSLRNKATGQAVCFVHGNGNSFDALKGLATQLKA